MAVWRPMRCYLFATVIFASVAPGLIAQTVKTPTEVGASEVAELTQRLDRQSLQLEALAREVSRLSSLIESRGDIAAAPRSATPAPSTPAPHPTTAAAPPAPTAAPIEVPPGFGIHVVAKGENLTFIARKYSTTIEEIQKTNKITDDRKLQIGQNLLVPIKPGEPGPTAAPTPSPSTSPTP